MLNGQILLDTEKVINLSKSALKTESKNLNEELKNFLMIRKNT